MAEEFTIDVWSDFVCPWCYLGATALDRLKESHDVKVRWHSFELRPVGSPPIPEWYREKIINSRPQFEAMAKENYNIKIASGPFGINSRPALIGMKYAEQRGKGDEYHHAVFSAYWELEQDISDMSVLRKIVSDIGMDADKFEQSLSNIELEAEVDVDIQSAQQFGITGVPAMVFLNKYLLSGAQPYEELVRIVDQIKERELAN